MGDTPDRIVRVASVSLFACDLDVASVKQFVDCTIDSPNVQAKFVG